MDAEFNNTVVEINGRKHLPTRAISMAHIEYRVNRLFSSDDTDSLIDGGANGGLASNDGYVVERSSTRVNVIGIDNHHMNNITLGTVASVARACGGKEYMVVSHNIALMG